MINLGIGIPFRRMGGGAANTARTQAFLTATGITDATIISALNAMDNSLISAGLLPSGTGAGKIKALYPIVGGTAGTHKFNFVNPADTDAAFRLTFFGGWTHSANGALTNGSNAYGNTYINPLANLTTSNTGFFGHYLRNNNASTNDILGISDGSSSLRNLGSDGTNSYARFYVSANSQANGVSRIDKTIIWNRFNAAAASVDCWRNGTKTTTLGAAFAAKPNDNIYIGCFNNIGTPVSYSVSAFAFLIFGDIGLTDIEAATLTSVIDTFQTTLGRNV
jgi:hypothetical protein